MSGQNFRNSSSPDRSTRPINSIVYAYPDSESRELFPLLPPRSLQVAEDYYNASGLNIKYSKLK